ncbi:MAG: DUF423 domain-containing protein [Bdellovibrionales bacterium]|nr:DUF423 domain-containing protein [Bdellovibrionales bacterium]
MLAGILAFLGVALGAFGAHALSERFGDYEKGVWQTAVHYHLIHALALFAFGIAYAGLPTPTGMSLGAVNAIGWCFAVGILLFSGSLYALALSGVKVLGAVTPLGGVAFLVGWGLVARAGYALAQSGN